MSEEEYIKFVENNNEAKHKIEMVSTLSAIVDILIKKEICTAEEFEKTKNECKKYSLKVSYKNENKDALDTIKTFNDIFGGLL